MNNKEVLRIKIKMCREELAHLTSELKRIDTGEDAWGDPADMSEKGRKELTERSQKNNRLEAFRRLGNKEEMDKLIKISMGEAV